MITVPQGGSVAGRSADIRIERPDMGGFISQVGSAVAQKMGQIKDQQRAVVVEKTKLDMTKELGEERLRLEQVTDPAQIEAEWPQVQARIQEKYVTGKDANGQPLLNPDEADALGLTLQDLGMKHGFALGERTIKLTDSQATAAWSSARLDIVNTAATADPDTMAALVEYGEAAIDRLPGLMPDQKQAQKQAFRGEVMNARVISAIDQDPEAAIAALNAGTYDALGAEAVAQRTATAQAEADRRAAAAAKQGEAETKTRLDAADKRLGTIADLTLKGRKVADRDEVINASDEVKALPNWAPAMAAIQLADEMPQLETMSVAELDVLIAAEEDRDIVHDWENERLPRLRAMREKLATDAAVDPKAAAIARGVIAPKGDLTFDPADPAAFSGALAEAVSQDALLNQKGYATGSAIFTKDQKAALTAVLAPDAEPAPKVELFKAILSGAGGNAGRVMTGLEADPVNRRALKFLGLTGNESVTTAILRGQQKIEAKTVVPLPRDSQIDIFDDLTGGVFEDAPVAVREEIMAATAALYADQARNINPTDMPAEADAVYRSALKSVIGAQSDRNGNLTVGGLQEVNGGLVVLPVGVHVDAVEETWYQLADALDATPSDPASMPMQTFKSASHYGGLPDLGSDPGGRLGTLTLQRVGESDVYELVRMDDRGRLTTVYEVGKDIPYRFRLKDLIRGARP